MADIWLRADYPIGPFAQQPIEQAVADVLAKAPWAAWQTGEVAFRYEYLDRPEAGTALLSLMTPPNRSAPNDGLRYAVPDAVERRTVTQHTVACPVSVTAPTQNQQIQIELECYTSYQGHFPSMSREQAIRANSPEMRLTRFRKRWRITNGQYPSLWFFWWGRDEHGGAGPAAGPAPRAPPGWERAPVRNYPIVRDPNVPTAPVYPFPGPSRLPPTAPAASTPGAGGPATGGNPNGLTRQEQLAALAASQNGSLDARQAYYVQQQLLQQQAQARGMAAAGGANPLAKMQQAQLIAQQQARQQFAAQQSAAAAAAAALAGTPNGRSIVQTPTSRKSNGSGKPNLSSATPAMTAQSASSAGAAAGSVLAARESTLVSVTPAVDILDVLTSRQLAMHRLAISQELIAPIFDPWTTTTILSGHKRKRQAQEAVRADALDNRTGESKGGIAGFGREHTLTILGTSAARIAVHAALGKDVNKATYSVEDRKDKLSGMLDRIKHETEMMEKKHAETVAKIKTGPMS
ncbi:uncharacterized protein JCM15063_000366 [Sporobolomyces koalae]|uniref:uncharacterized protein n=1 Tax=Sporobolomyces koalae TaxID=500713 RepID=UPI003170464E